MNSSDSNFILNPYDCLNVPEFCKDFDVIKAAYKQKSIFLDPKNTNGLTSFEFSNLNKSYLYLKRKFIDVGKGNDLLENDLKRRVRERNLELPKATKHSSILETVTSFDRDSAFQELMRFRPTSTRYSSALPALQPGVAENYMKHVNPWGGSENESAPIIANSQQMFVQGSESLEQYASVSDIPTRSYEETGKVNRNEVNTFMRMYHDVQNVPKISNKGFNQKMKDMDSEFSKKLTLEAQENEEYLNSILGNIDCAP